MSIIGGLVYFWPGISGTAAAKSVAVYALACAGFAVAALAWAVWVSLTARKIHLSSQQQQATITKLRTMWNDAPLSIILFDPHDPKVRVKIVDCNPMACEKHGYTREELIDRVWDGRFGAESNVVETYVRNLRRKLGDEVVRTMRGLGYSFPEGE